LPWYFTCEYIVLNQSSPFITLLSIFSLPCFVQQLSVHFSVPSSMQMQCILIYHSSSRSFPLLPPPVSSDSPTIETCSPSLSLSLSVSLCMIMLVFVYNFVFWIYHI
jgi:hypothetical protein